MGKPQGEFGRRMDVMSEVIAERARQDATFGVQNHDLSYWTVIAVEQIGQMGQAVCDMRWGGGRESEVRKQAIQIAAVGMAIAECIDRGEYADDITTAKPSDKRQLSRALGVDDEQLAYGDGGEDGDGE